MADVSPVSVSVSAIAEVDGRDKIVNFSIEADGEKGLSQDEYKAIVDELKKRGIDLSAGAKLSSLGFIETINGGTDKHSYSSWEDLRKAARISDPKKKPEDKGGSSPDPADSKPTTKRARRRAAPAASETAPRTVTAPQKLSSPFSAASTNTSARPGFAMSGDRIAFRVGDVEGMVQSHGNAEDDARRVLTTLREQDPNIFLAGSPKELEVIFGTGDPATDVSMPLQELMDKAYPEMGGAEKLWRENLGGTFNPERMHQFDSARAETRRSIEAMRQQLTKALQDLLFGGDIHALLAWARFYYMVVNYLTVESGLNLAEISQGILDRLEGVGNSLGKLSVAGSNASRSFSGLVNAMVEKANIQKGSLRAAQDTVSTAIRENRAISDTVKEMMLNLVRDIEEDSRKSMWS